MINQVSIHRLNGEAVFQLGNTAFESTFVIEYTSAKALIRFTSDKDIFPLPSGLTFNGHTNNGMAISGEIDSYNNNITDKVIIADLTYLHIGNEEVLDDVQEVKANLIGVYYPYHISFQHEKYFIEFRKSESSLKDAKRTKEATGAILSGNEIVIK